MPPAPFSFSQRVANLQKNAENISVRVQHAIDVYCILVLTIENKVGEIIHRVCA